MALEELDRRPGGRALSKVWVPGGALAATAIVALVLVNRGPAPVDPSYEAAVATDATDMDLLLGDEDLQMLEDLEFFAWVDIALTAQELEDLDDLDMLIELES